MNTDDDIRDLLGADDGTEQASTHRIAKVLKRTRAGVGQRDTLLLALVRIWAAIAAMLAPVFAQFAVRKAELDNRNPSSSAAKTAGK